MQKKTPNAPEGSRYAYGNGLDEPVEIEKDVDGNGVLDSYIPMQNTNGSVIGIADSNGILKEKVNYSAYGVPTFIYDHEPPKVDQVRIDSGEVYIRFSEPVVEAKARGAIKVKRGVDDLSGSFAFNEKNRRAIFTPSSALPQNELLMVQVTTGLEDLFGNKQVDEFSQDFTFVGENVIIYDRAAPEVEVVKMIGSEFFVEFSEEIHPGTIADSINITSSQGTLTGVATQEDDKTLKFIPGNTLASSVEYTINVKTTLTDWSGKNLGRPFSVSFVKKGNDALIYEKPEPSEHKESAISNNILFQGREYESETGLYYFRARYYNPKLGRFLQTDPMGYEDSMNLYQSFGNNPANFTDPMGLEVLNRNQLEGAYWWTSNVSGMNFTFREFVNEYAQKKNQRVYLHKGKVLYTYDSGSINNEGDVITHDGGEYVHHNPTYTLIPIKHHKYGDRWNLMNDLKPNRREYGKQDYQNIHSFTHHFDPRNKLQNPLVHKSVKEAALKTIAKHHVMDRETALYVSDGYRTFEQQQQAHASNPGGAAVAGHSWHNYGLAVDIVPQNQNGGPMWPDDFNWQTIGQSGLSSGFREWGGNWQEPFDRPHYQNAYSDRVSDDVLDINNSEGGGYQGVQAVQIFNELMQYPLINGNVQAARVLTQFLMIQ